MNQNPIRLNVNHMMADVIGDEHGIRPENVAALSLAAAKAQKQVQAQRGTGWLGWMELPNNQQDILKEIDGLAASIREKFDTFVVLGIGGSALGPIAVHQALNHLHYNELPAEKRNGPRFYVEDNIDPERMAALLDIIDIRTTCFNLITKSGATAETMSQALIITDLLKRACGADWASHIVATTSQRKGNLIALSKEFGFPALFIPDGVGGRYSELCPVGLLPAAVCGIDIHALLAGAAAMDARCRSEENVWKNPALLEAVLLYISMQKMGINIHVMMPYADSLKYMADWFAQLWAESLGKKVSRSGAIVHAGQTPVKSLGVTDQHSQLQLYTEGPFDKLITLLSVENFRNEMPIPHEYSHIPDLNFLGGLSQNQLIHAEQQGTEYALTHNERINQKIVFPEVNAHTIGQFLYFWEMVTAYTGELLDIDAFNQPGVEESKIASYAVLGNQAEKYRQKAEEMKAGTPDKDKYIL